MAARFHRFEQYQSQQLTPDLSSGSAPVIEGQYMYFCLLHKEAGSGSELHYHPNELVIFPLRGKVNAIVGRARRIIAPGMFLHAPAYARHSMKATEESACDYLYIKDRTWTVVGLAADEAVPDKALTIEEVNRQHQAGGVSRRQATGGKSEMIIDGLGTCFYPVIDSFDAPGVSARRVLTIEGAHIAFSFFDVPAHWSGPEEVAQHETFVYVINGSLRAETGGGQKTLGAGDIVSLSSGDRYRLQPDLGQPARYVQVSATAKLERRMDSMSPQEREQARLNVKPN